MFLAKALESLRRENMFNELKSVSVDQLIFVKDDVILPHHYSFYDFQLTGQISHAGKICLRSWYERNKHIFPACRWEPYDPEKRWSAHEPPKNRFSVK
jgi:protein FAM50